MEFIYIPVEDQAAFGGNGGAPAAFKNDGNFLERMKAELATASAGDKKTSLNNVTTSAVAVK